MDRLTLPRFAIQYRQQGESKYVFSKLRKKYVLLTPEEWVRQHLVHYLTQHLGYPSGLIKEEVALQYGRLSKRADLIIYHQQTVLPLMLVECKAAQQALAEEDLDQLIRYNHAFKAPFITLTNGRRHLCYHIDYTTKEYGLLAAIPSYTMLLTYQ